MKKNNKGFTLVELLAVIIILALIMVIAIPSILDTMNQARKESFYLYAQSLQSKALAAYTSGQDENDQDTFECVVYDIEKDLDIKNTGDYEGWVKVNREPIKSDTKRSASITVTSPTELEYVRYCVEKSNSCTPNKTFAITEGDKTATVIQSIGEGQTMCVNYQTAQDNKLVESEKKCMSYNDASEIVQSYKYNIVLTFKSNNYGVSEFNINEEEISKKTFYAAMDDFTKAAKSKKTNPMAIVGPKCSADEPDQIKGTTTIVRQEDDPNYTTTKPTTSVDISKCPVITDDKKQFNIILNPNGGVIDGETKINQCVDCDTNVSIAIPTREGYIFEGWYYDKAFSKQLTGNASNRVEANPKRDSQYCISGYNDVYLYAKWKLDESKTTTPTTGIYEHTTSESSSVDTTEFTTTEDPRNTQPTTEITTTTTTRDITDHTLLLDSMNVAGYPIDFSPIKFNYEITVPNSQSNVSVSYQANTPDQTTVTVTGADNLEVGDNVVLVRLTNTVTGKEGDYRIVVSKLDAQGHKVTQPQQPTYEEWDPSSGLPDPKLDESNASLKSLTLSGYDFEFDPNVYEYQLDVFNLNPLLISYETASKGAFVNITGNENTLKDGDIVTLYVQSPNGYYHKEYTIQANYKKKTSEQTKYLRTIIIVLLVILVAALIINYTNKKHHRSIIKKKTDNKEQNNQAPTEPVNNDVPTNQDISNPGSPV